MHLIPHELYVGEIFFPPMLLDAALGLVAATITARLSNRFRVSRYFYGSSAKTVGGSGLYRVRSGVAVGCNDVAGFGW